MTLRAIPLRLGAGLLALVSATAAAQPAGDSLAARQLQSGLAFLQDGNFEEALEDFEAVVGRSPGSEIAAEAIVQIARYHLEVAGDLDRAVATAQTLLDDPAYAQREATSTAQLIQHRAALRRSRSEAEVADAAASFQRWLQLNPDATATPEALFYLGDALRRARRLEEAQDALRRAVAEGPTGPVAGRAQLVDGELTAMLGDPIGAMEAFQQVREEFPDRPEAAEALARITVLYRLFVRPGETPYALRTSTDRGARPTRNVIALAALPDGNVVLATDRSISSLRAPATPLPSAARPRGLAVYPDGAVGVIEGGSLSGRGTRLQFAVPERGDRRAIREVDAVVATSTGDWLVADREGRTIQRFTARGDYLGPYARVRAERLAIDPLDRVAVLDDDERIALYDGGTAIAQLSTRVANRYTIDNPVDLAFDGFGHLYVLDREGVYIFGLDRQLLKRFPASENAPGSFDRASALALDRLGRLYVADRRDRLIFVLE